MIDMSSVQRYMFCRCRFSSKTWNIWRFFSYLSWLVVCSLHKQMRKCEKNWKGNSWNLNRIFGGGDKKKDDGKGKCSVYKGRCGGKISNTCCKAPLKCGKSTAVCGKDKLCCITEADVQRQKQDSGSNWLSQRNG